MAQKQTREAMGVQAGDRIYVKGYVKFARLDKLVEGKELEKTNSFRRSRGAMETGPYRSIRIENPEVVFGAGTPLANFHMQNNTWQDKDGTTLMELESKAPNPPNYGYFLDNGDIKQMVDPQKNPAVGQEVFIEIVAFKSKSYPNLGSSFNGIVFPNENIQYYQPNGGINGFAEAFGGKIIALTPEEIAQANTQNAEPEPNANMNAGGYNQENANTYQNQPAPQQNFNQQAPQTQQNFNQPASQPNFNQQANPFGQPDVQNQQNQQGAFQGMNAQNLNPNATQQVQPNPFGMSDEQAQNQQNQFSQNTTTPNNGSPFA